jgi:hypothetical protein
MYKQFQENKMFKGKYKNLLLLISTLLLSGTLTFISAQEKDKKVEKPAEAKSIGGKEHNTEILGVKIGMDIPTALQSVFVNANRKAGQEKPDAKKNEGKDGKDVRVIYKGLPQGDLQIVFAQGKFVKEIVLMYAKTFRYSDLALPYSGSIGEAIDGTRYDDRYTIGFTDSQAVQGLYWRDESAGDYKVRLMFTTANRLKEAASALGFQTIIQKSLHITPGDEEKFLKALKITK